MRPPSSPGRPSRLAHACAPYRAPRPRAHVRAHQLALRRRACVRPPQRQPPTCATPVSAAPSCCRATPRVARHHTGAARPCRRRPKVERLGQFPPRAARSNPPAATVAAAQPPHRVLTPPRGNTPVCQFTRPTLKKWCFGRVRPGHAVRSSFLDLMAVCNPAVTRPYRLPENLNKKGKGCFRRYAVLFFCQKRCQTVIGSK